MPLTTFRNSNTQRGAAENTFSPTRGEPDAPESDSR
jgi:hypothetical protein